MRIGFLSVFSLLALALCGCVQSPDWIESTVVALDGGGSGGGGGGGTGGMGGSGGTGGMGGSGGTGGMGGGGGTGGMGGVGGLPNDAGAIECNPRLDRALLLFLPLDSDADRDGDNLSDRCTYNVLDAELRQLLEELIYSMDPEEPNPEVVPPDRYCNEFNLQWRALIGDPFDPDNPAKVLMCPRFCVALRNWVAERQLIELQCMSGAP